MSALANDLLLRALMRQPTPRTPVWMMRQAGRYLPEYRAVREKAGDFMSLCSNPELACEVTLQPLRRFRLDAAILFSDILTIPDAMGLGLRFVEGEGPVFDRPVRTAHDIEALPVPDPENELRYVMDAVRTIHQALAGRIPLIGFAGSPWTLATYMVEGAGGSDFTLIKQLGYDAPGGRHGASLAYNASDERLFFAGRGGEPDAYEQPFHSLDLIYSYYPTDSLSLKFRLQNLLDEQVVIEQGGVDVIEQSVGSTFKLDLSYRF